MQMSNVEQLEGEIRSLAKNLRLGSSIASLYKEAAFEKPALFVRDLLPIVWNARLRDRIARRQAMAGLLASKTLESFDTSCLELPTSVELNWFTECRFIGAKQNLILQGPPGTGKTHFATALGLQACKQGYKCQMKRMATLVEELTAAYEAKELTAYKQRLEMADVLIIDEWGYLPITVTGTRLLFDIIADCYECRSVILTTNMPVAEWNKIFCDERLLMAIIDRIVHHGYLIRHTGDSYRLTHSLMA